MSRIKGMWNLRKVRFNIEIGLLAPLTDAIP